MKKKMKYLKNIIIKKNITTYLIIALIILGVTAGSIFFLVINKTDKESAVKEIVNFQNMIINNKINYGQTLKNSIFTNFTYLFSIFILSLTIIGTPFIIFLLFFKGFIIGFSISAIIALYNYKGIIYSIIYLIPQELIKLFAIFIMGSYSLTLTIKLLKLIFSNKKNDFKLHLKRSSLIFIVSLFIITLALLYETYLYPNILKMLINFFI